MLTAFPGKSKVISDVKREQDSLLLYSEYGIMKLEFITCDTAHVIFTTEDSFSKKEKPGVIYNNIFSDWKLTEDTEFIYAKTDRLTVRILKKNGSISYFDSEDRLLFQENNRSPREFEKFDTFILSGGEQKTGKIQTADGEKEVILDPEKLATGHSYHIRLNMSFGDEALYGLGQQEKGFASLREHYLYVHQANRQIAIPMFVSTNGYGILIDSYSPLIFSDINNESYIYIEAAPELDYYFFAGSMKEVIKGYRRLTGKASLLPKWAYGYVQSQERYETADEIIEVVERSRELGLGLDCIVLDWISWGDNLWGQKTFDKKRFPDPKAMLDKLHENNVHFMISIWPTCADNTEDNREFKEIDGLLPACTAYNAFSKRSREIYWRQLEREHFSSGVDAWWCDSSEPFTPEWNHTMRMEPSKLYAEYCTEAGLRMPYEYCNSYALYHAMGIYDNQRAAMRKLREKNSNYKEKRVCNLTRSAYTGQQRYGTIMWSGDIAAKWQTLRDQIAIGLHFSASGLPLWTVDVGGFFVKSGMFWYWDGAFNDTVNNPGYAELYTRWYQFACFLPVFRCHGTDCRRELWSFKGRFYDALKAANKLRYELMPYIYSEAGKVWLRDESLIRWLAFDFTQDKRTWDITDQYMFGSSLMICPVTEPIYYNENGEEITAEAQREVYLPIGCDWYDYYTGEKHKGGQTIKAYAPLERIPVFVKAGSAIPTAAPALSTAEQTGEIQFKVFSEHECSYEMYKDAGDGYGYERGEYEVQVFNFTL